MKRLGYGFADSFRRSHSRSKSLLSRVLFLYIISGGLLLLILGRLVQLQIVEGSSYFQRSESNRVSLLKIKAPRGNIFDRNGEALTRNVVVKKIDEVTQAEYEDVRREYVYSDYFSHMIGYVAEISEFELEGRRGYGQGDIIGKMGIEKQMERRLRGEKGGLLVETGVDGKVIRRLKEIKPVSGQDVKLSVDTGMQKKVIEILNGRKGAVVVSEVDSGEVLALVSSPGFNPNIFSSQLPGAGDEQRLDILKNIDKPMFNRVLAGLYPPGSVFKIVTAVAGLEIEVIDKSFEIEDTGEIKVGEFRYGNWYFDQYGRLEGSVNIVTALKRSNDIFFYRLGEMIGAQKLADWAEKFGFGKLVNLKLGNEAVGVVPSPKWKDEYMGERWFLGNTYHMAIGQGDLQVTPLQVHQMTGVIANRGRLCSLTLINGSKSKCKDLEISEKTLDIVTEGLVAVCSAGGTAFPFFDFSTKQASPSGKLDMSERVACKTGTAQFSDPEERTHAWLVAFGPAQKPEILVTVLLEAAGEGSYEAGPVAREIFDYWFKERG